MLNRISKVMGCIPQTWQAGFDMAAKSGVANVPGALMAPMKEQVIHSLSNAIPNASKTALDLIMKMLAWNPKDRLSCQQCLQHEFFNDKSEISDMSQ